MYCYGMEFVITNIWVISNKTLEKLSPEDAKIIQEVQQKLFNGEMITLQQMNLQSQKIWKRMVTKFARLTDEERQEV